MLSPAIIHFLQNQRFTIVSTIDKNGMPHASCKGIVNIDSEGRIYLLDLYKAKTYENLKQNPHISITAVDEHHFKGWCLKGKAKLIKRNRVQSHIKKAWEDKITSRIRHRIIRNIRGEKGHPRHPEVLLPNPEYMIAVDVKEIVNLAPTLYKKQAF